MICHRPLLYDDEAEEFMCGCGVTKPLIMAPHCADYRNWEAIPPPCFLG